ncbi:major capsid family protein [Campylobacter sp. 9BO]|uniref:major capsid family protein n=1 Tax=Campylobacter sp. 9BO TaxID=3424759 RepID=UPI003D34DDF3
MRFKDSDIFSAVAAAATTYNEGFNERTYPDIGLNKFLTLTQKGDAGDDEIAYGEVSGTHDLDGGFIDENTTSIELSSVNYTAQKAPYIAWQKGAIYTDLAVSRALRLGESLDATELSNLEREAYLAAQRVALIGSKQKTNLHGLLTHPRIKTQDLSSCKAIAEMNGAELRDFFLKIVELGYDNNGGMVQPSTIVLGCTDLRAAALKFDATLGTQNANISAVTAIKAALKDSGVDIEILGVPFGLARGISKKTANRVAIYSNREDVVSADWSIVPTALEPIRKDTGYSVSILAKYTGAIIRQLDKVAYIDYKA